MLASEIDAEKSMSGFSALSGVTTPDLAEIQISCLPPLFLPFSAVGLLVPIR
jgi:hypothetical protein